MKKYFIIIFVFLFANNSFSKENFYDLFIKRYDIDKDGKISEQDMEQHSLLEFREADKNKDNKLSKDEFYKIVCKNSCEFGNCMCNNVKDNNFENLQYLKDYWDKINKNNDDYIDINEKLENDKNDFLNLDFNLDGYVTKEELKNIIIKNEN